MRSILKCTCWLLLFSACMAWTEAWAQQADSVAGKQADTATLANVIVSATRLAALQQWVPYSSYALQTPMEQAYNPRTSPEALSYVPGVFVQRTNHGGGSPFLRGLTGNQILMMIDGIRFNNSTFRFGPNQYLNLIDAYTVDRLEVVKGSGSVQYGSDAMGGVVQAFTYDPGFAQTPQWHGNAAARYTTADMEYTARLSAGYQAKNATVSGGITFRQFGHLVGGDTTGRQSPSGYSENDWNLKTKFRVGAQAELIISAQQVSQYYVPLYHRIALENFEYYFFHPQKMLLSYARLKGATGGKWARQWNVTAVYKNSTEGRQYHRRNNANYFEEKDVVDSYGFVADVYSVFSKSWSATSGIEWYTDVVSSSRQRTNGSNVINERGLYPNGALQHNFSVFSLHHVAWKKWHAEAGLRYNLVQNKIPATFTELPGVPNGESVSITPASLAGNMGLTYTMAQKHALYASVSNGYRAPGIDDMGTLGLVDFRYEVPAYDLKAERSVQSEIGYRFDGNKVQLQANAFYMHITNLVSRVRSGKDSILGYPVYVKTNDQQAFVRGMEVSGEWEVIRFLKLSAFVAGQYGENLSRNEPMRRVPPLNGLVSLFYKRKFWYAGAELQWAESQTRLAQGDKDDNRIPAGGTPGWQVWNVHAGYTANLLQIRLSFLNLLNADYRTHGSGINNMGRALTASATIHF